MYIIVIAITYNKDNKTFCTCNSLRNVTLGEESVKDICMQECYIWQRTGTPYKKWIRPYKEMFIMCRQ